MKWVKTRTRTELKLELKLELQLQLQLQLQLKLKLKRDILTHSRSHSHSHQSKLPKTTPRMRIPNRLPVNKVSEAPTLNHVEIIPGLPLLNNIAPPLKLLHLHVVYEILNFPRAQCGEDKVSKEGGADRALYVGGLGEAGGLEGAGEVY